MKKNFLRAMFLLLILPLGFVFTGCDLFRRVDRYTSVVPTHLQYEATLSYRNHTNLGDDLYTWYVGRDTREVAGENRDILYLEYAYTDLENEAHNRTATYLFVGGKAFFLDGAVWADYESSTSPNKPYDKWNNVYGSYSKPGSFVYELTEDINGRDFAKRDKTDENEKYIEYTVDDGEEVIRISNDPYHLLLLYTFDYVESENNFSHVRKEATFEYHAPTKQIITTSITLEMLV